MRQRSEHLGIQEKKALRLIARRERRGDPSPALLEIGCAVGSEGTQGVEALLACLSRNGYLIRDEGWDRMLRLSVTGWRLFLEEQPAEPRHPEAPIQDGMDADEMAVGLVGGETLPKRSRRHGDPRSRAPMRDVPVDPGDGPSVEPTMPGFGTDTEDRSVHALRAAHE